MKAQGRRPARLPLFGLVNLTDDQTARLNAVNPRDPQSPRGICRVLLQFVDEEGVVLKQEMKTLLPEQGSFLEMTGAEALGPRGGARLPIRAVMSAPPDDSCPNPVATAEIIETTGKTSLFINPAAANPPDDSAPAPISR